MKRRWRAKPQGDYWWSIYDDDRQGPGLYTAFFWPENTDSNLDDFVPALVQIMNETMSGESHEQIHLPGPDGELVTYIRQDVCAAISARLHDEIEKLEANNRALFEALAMFHEREPHNETVAGHAAWCENPYEDGCYCGREQMNIRDGNAYDEGKATGDDRG